MKTIVKHFIHALLALLVSCAAIAQQAEPPRRELTSEEIAGFRAASAAVLHARRQAREAEQADPARRALAEFRRALIELRDDLMSVSTPATLTIEGASSRAGRAGGAGRRPMTKRAVDDLTAMLETFERRAEERARTSRGQRPDKLGRAAARRVERMTTLELRLRGLEHKSRAEQLATINALLERTALVRGREPRSMSAAPPPGVSIETNAPSSPTPALSFGVRHRR